MQASPTPSSQQSPLTLFSLSDVAASAEPIQIPTSSFPKFSEDSLDADVVSSSLDGGLARGSYGSVTSTGPSGGALGALRELRDRDGKVHKKASSQGRMNRRLSDAKDAASR